MLDCVSSHFVSLSLHLCISLVFQVAVGVLVALHLCIQSCSGSFGGFALCIQVVARVLVALHLRIQIRQ